MTKEVFAKRIAATAAAIEANGWFRGCMEEGTIATLPPYFVLAIKFVLDGENTGWAPSLLWELGRRKYRLDPTDDESLGLFWDSETNRDGYDDLFALWREHRDNPEYNLREALRRARAIFDQVEGNEDVWVAPAADNL